jgi:beta-phosphoglucomutase
MNVGFFYFRQLFYAKIKCNMHIYPRAFIFDLNGTMINDMEYHAKVWHHILNDELHANLSYEQVRKQMYGKNEEVIVRIFGADHFTIQEMQEISIRKEKDYQRLFLPELKLINGLPQFLEKAALKNIPLGIASAAIPFNIDFVLDNLHIRHFFKTIVSADDVVMSKPDPEVFTLASIRIGVEPNACLVFEDSPKGVEAALRAGMNAIAITTMHEPIEFEGYTNVLGLINDYSDNLLNQLFE